VAEGFIDQAAVALLRPLLKQWLDSNMRSVLEKALHVEAENAKNREP
jgi:cell pole-organizing protein PopZ